MNTLITSRDGVQTKLLWAGIAALGAVSFGIVALNRGETISAAWLVIAALCTYFIAFRFYALFIASRVLGVDPGRQTPAYRHNDALDYVPTNRYVLFGHHFAAIAGAGPLVGPVLAAQMGYLPGTLWILAGVVFAGAVQDMTVLFLSTRRDGKSLGDMIRSEMGPDAGGIAGIGILLLALIYGRTVSEDPEIAPWFTYGGETLALAVIGYGFVASVLPVWLLLAPRDYLSTFLKIGTIALLAVGIMIVRSDLQMPAVTKFIDGSGPVWSGSVFPFLFITIACGAVSGWHALIASGTTPKMIENERQIVFIG